MNIFYYHILTVNNFKSNLNLSLPSAHSPNRFCTIVPDPCRMARYSTMCSRGFHVSSALFLMSFPYPSDRGRHPKNDSTPEGPISYAGQTLCVHNLCTSALVGFSATNQYIFQMVFSSGLTTDPPGFARWFPTRTHYCRNWGTGGAFGGTIYP